MKNHFFAAKFFLILALIMTSFSVQAQRADTSAADKPKSDTLSLYKKIDSLTLQVAQINEKLQKQTNKVVSAGISLAYRKIFSNFQHSYQSASISPIDSTLKLTNLDLEAVVLSTSIVVCPWVNSKELLAVIDSNSSELRRLRQEKRQQKRTDKRADSIDDVRQDNKAIRRLMVNQAFCKLVQNFGFTANINMLDFSQAQNASVFNKSIEGGIGFSLRLSPNIHISYTNELIFSQQLRDDIKSQENKKIYLNGQVVNSISQLDVNNLNYYVTKNLIAHSFRIIIVF
jgi:hypothetical protein